MPRLAEHTTTTAQDLLGDAEVVLLPTGSTEQHGPALPLGTDFMAAQAIARAVGKHKDAVVLPTVPVGVSEHHRQFHGTLWVDPDTFESYVREVLESAASHGVRKAVVVNGHGGNADALVRVARALRREQVMFAPAWNWWDSVGELPEELFEGAGGHADQMESSMMLRVAGDLVRNAALQKAEDGASDGWGKEIHGAQVGFDTADFSDSGAVGEPTQASREAGEQLFDRATAELGALVDWLSEQPIEGLWPADHR